MKNGVFFHSYGDVYQRDVQRDIVMETCPLRGVSQFDMLMEEIERDGSSAGCHFSMSFSEKRGSKI
jgi:hypothetical protein